MSCSAATNQRVVGDRDATLDEAGTDLGVVQDRHGDAGARSARRAAAGAAVERRGMRVVDSVAAVPAQHHHRRELGQADRGDDRFGEQRPLLEREPGVEVGADGLVDDRRGPGSAPNGFHHGRVAAPLVSSTVRGGSSVRAAATGPAIHPADSASANGDAMPPLAAWNASWSPAVAEHVAR